MHANLCRSAVSLRQCQQPVSQRHFTSLKGLFSATGRRHRRRSRFQVQRHPSTRAFWGAWGGKADGGSEEQGAFDSKQGTDRRKALLEYVQNVDPKVVTQFSEVAPATVVDAMRSTVTNMLGTIPPQFFEVKVSSSGENLAQLMFSVLLTGDTASSLDEVQETATPVAVGAEEVLFAPGTQKLRVEGEVLRWHLASDSAETISALDYIHMLELENDALKRQAAAAELRQRAAGDGNGLLAYLKSLDQENVELLTRSASDDVIEAMNTFVHKLLGTSDLREMRKQQSESNAVELAQLLYWLMIVGFMLRQMEVRLDLSSLGLAEPGHLLPPGHV